MPYVQIQAADESGVAVVTLDRPERLNALSPSLVTELSDALRGLFTRRDVRAVVLAGNGRGFCSGFDLASRAEGDLPPDGDGRGPVGSFWVLQQQLSDLITLIHEARVPVVGAVQGAAVGGGLALALACDLRVAAPDVRFGSVFVKVGLSSCDMGVSYFLPRIVGATRAADLLLTGRLVDAAEAERIGLVNSVSEPGAHVEAAIALARQVTRHSEFSTWLTKSGMWTNLDAPSLRSAIELENRTQALGTFTGNLDEYEAAFTEKRPPNWKPM
jgi:enoyl-CoA hydratase